MSNKKVAIRTILCYLQKNGLRVRVVVKDVESPETVNKHMAQSLFRCLNEGVTKVRETCYRR